MSTTPMSPTPSSMGMGSNTAKPQGINNRRNSAARTLALTAFIGLIGAADLQSSQWTSRIDYLDLSHGVSSRPSTLNRNYALETNPHPDPLPFTKGGGNLRGHPVRVTEQGSETGAHLLSPLGAGRGSR